MANASRRPTHSRVLAMLGGAWRANARWTTPSISRRRPTRRERGTCASGARSAGMNSVHAPLASDGSRRSSPRSSGATAPLTTPPQQFAHAAQHAQQHHQLLAPYAAVAGGIHEPPGLDPAADVHMRSRSSAAPSGVEEHKSSIDKVQQAIEEQQFSIVELKKVVEELVQEVQGIKKIMQCSCAGHWPALPSGPQEPDGRHDARWAITEDRRRQRRRRRRRGDYVRTKSN